MSFIKKLIIKSIILIILLNSIITIIFTQSKIDIKQKVKEIKNNEKIVTKYMGINLGTSYTDTVDIIKNLKSRNIQRDNMICLGCKFC